MGRASVFASLPYLAGRWRLHRAGQERFPPPWRPETDQGGASPLFDRLDWETAGADELIYLVPSLSLVRRPSSDAVAPVMWLRQALVARIHIVVSHLCAHDNPRRISPAAALRAIGQAFADGANEVSPREAWLSGEASAAVKAFYPGVGRGAPGLERTGGAAAFPLGPAEGLASEVLVLGALDRAHTHAREPDGAASAAARSVGVAEAAVVSIYSGINAAYIYRHLDWAHELLTTAAWLGLLVRGRAAYLPSAVGHRLDELGERVQQSSPADLDPVDAILWRHAVVGCDAARLFEAARIVVETQRGMMVEPTPGARSGLIGVLGAQQLPNAKRGS